MHFRALKPAAELQQITSSMWVWQSYASSIKADLSSTALLAPAGIYVVDPIPLEKAPAALLAQRQMAGVILTNANHHRSATDFAKQFSIAIFSHEIARPQGPVTFVREGDCIGAILRVIEIPGAGPGEIALYDERDGGSLVIGDALINFGMHDFGLLPAKYCEDEKQMRASLRKLLAFDFQYLLFAHGVPVISNAKRKLAVLLGVDPT
ncbi:MAG: hypothetical protein ABR526_05445 [Chthoniobacterales bacterium]